MTDCTERLASFITVLIRLAFSEGHHVVTNGGNGHPALLETEDTQRLFCKELLPEPLQGPTPDTWGWDAPSRTSVRLTVEHATSRTGTRGGHRH